jgi:hypothetical protein
MYEKFCADMFCIEVKVKCCYRPGVAQRVPGGLGSQIFMMFGK